MNVAHWNLIKPDSRISGLKRYDDMLYSKCSEYGDVKRYSSKENKFASFVGYKSADITHITTHQIAFLKTFKAVKNCIVTVHDVTPSHWYSKRRNFNELWYLNELFMSQVKHFIADSNYTKMDLIDTFKIKEDIIDVVYLGVDHNTFYPEDRDVSREKMGFQDDEIVCFGVSSGEPWKNVGILKKLPYRVIDIGYGRGKFGYVDDDMLRTLYSACDVFLAPSKAEGFGLPILEAQACGCPVVASWCTSYPEVVGKGGQLVDPDDPDHWIRAVENAVKNRTKWGKLGIENAAKFSWELMGKQTWNVYEKLME